MGFICAVCGFENEDGEKKCVMCGTDLEVPVTEERAMDFRDQAAVFQSQSAYVESAPVQVKTVAQVQRETRADRISGTSRYYVECQNARVKTAVPSRDITSYYCPGCKEEHPIDGFLWIVEEEQEEQTPAPAQTPSVNMQVNSEGEHRLILEDMDTHVTIEIDMEGGTLGRYGDYGAAYLQGIPNGRMVSGEHCRFLFDRNADSWTILHLSRTNDTVYNNRRLEHDRPERIRNGKILVLANAVRFMIRIM